MDQKSLRRWIENVQTLIGKVITSEGISASVLDVIQAPMVITFKIQLTNPTKTNVNNFANLARTFEQTVGEAPIRVYPMAGYFVVEIPSPNPVSPHGEMFVNHVTSNVICLGYDTEVQPVLLNLERYPSILWIAPPRSGKTSSVRSVIYSQLKVNNHTEEKLSFLICAEKLEYWRAFIGKRGVVEVSSDFDSMAQLLQDVSKQLSRKAKIGEHFDPPLIIVIDDMLRVLAQTDLATTISEIASTGGSVGVYLYLITQSAGSNAGTGGIKVEDNIAARVIYKTSSKIAAARSTGEDAAGIDQLTNQQGDALFVLGSNKTRITTGFVSDSDIAKLPDATVQSNLLRYFHLGENTPTIERNLDLTPIEPISDFGLQLPKISPPRALVESEINHLHQIVSHFQNIGNPLSKNKLMLEIFGGKNGKYKQFLEDALNRTQTDDLQTNHV